MRSLITTQLSLLFFVPGIDFEGVTDVANKIHAAAHSRIASGLNSVPGFVYYCDNNGFETQDSTAMALHRYDLCDYDFEVEMIDGRPAFAIAFQAHNFPPAGVIPSLISYCSDAYKEVSGDVLVEFAQAKVRNEWNISETYVYDYKNESAASAPQG